MSDINQHTLTYYWILFNVDIVRNMRKIRAEKDFPVYSTSLFLLPYIDFKIIELLLLPITDSKWILSAIQITKIEGNRWETKETTNHVTYEGVNPDDAASSLSLTHLDHDVETLCSYIREAHNIISNLKLCILWGKIHHR